MLLPPLCIINIVLFEGVTYQSKKQSYRAPFSFKVLFEQCFVCPYFLTFPHPQQYLCVHRCVFPSVPTPQGSLNFDLYLYAPYFTCYVFVFSNSYINGYVEFVNILHWDKAQETAGQLSNAKSIIAIILLGCCVCVKYPY